jgi:hypothetical protein
VTTGQGCRKDFGGVGGVPCGDGPASRPQAVSGPASTAAVKTRGDAHRISTHTRAWSEGQI